MNNSKWPQFDTSLGMFRTMLPKMTSKKIQAQALEVGLNE